MTKEYKNFVLPETYFMGATAMNRNEMDRYLRDTDQLEFLEEVNKAREEGLSDGEILCSFYAKACYASLTDKKNKNITKTRDIASNIEGIINSGHGCYSEDTEVLTDNGWKKFQDLNGSELFVTLNKDQSVSFSKAKRYFEYDYNDKLLMFSNSGVDLLVTPNHRMYVCKTSTKEGRKKKDFDFYVAENLLNQSHCYIKSSKPKDEGQFIPLFQLLGFAIGDGSIKKNHLSFNLKKERKIKYLENICNILGVALNKTKGGLILSLNDFQDENKKFFKSIYNKNKEKVIPNQLLFSKDDSILKSIFDGLINSDGSVDKNSCIVYDTTSEFLAGQFQALCMFLGTAANISQAPCYKDRSASFGDKPMYRCHVITRTLKPEINFGKKQGNIQQVNYSGKVYCVEVENNTLYVRRNGKAVWCGNSVAEHCFLNFMMRDCSRVYTHELVRHRAGTAFSQTSGRYVRSDILNIVYDPILDPIKEECEEIRQVIEMWYNDMQNKLILEGDNFSAKKKKTSALRRFLPNGQANEIGFSVNLRSLRHTIEMRTSSHAEWEIRLIFNQVYNLVNAKYPKMFFDAKVEKVDGLNEICFDNKKI